MDARVLLIDDEPDFTKSVTDAFYDRGVNVEHAATWEDGEQLFRVGMHDLVIADFDLAGARDGLLLLAKLKDLRPGARLLLISGKSVTIPAETIESSKVVDRFLVKDVKLMTELLDEAAASEKRAKQSSDWRKLAERHVAASDVDKDHVEEIDALMRSALEN